MKLNDLYDKVKDFESNITNNALKHSSCANGCSKCCFVDLSVFSIEAINIKEWFLNLSESEKKLLQKKLKSPPKQDVNFHGETVNSCAFLYENSCSIYPVRPLICRTQGMALMVEKNYVDICPLNSKMLDVLKNSDVINLEILNQILSQLQLHYQKNSKRITLSSLANELLKS